MSRHLHRFAVLMATVAAAIASVPHMSRAEAVNLSGGYASRGKRKTKTHSGSGNGASVSQRAATKSRNRAKHRAACRGAA